MGPTRAAVEAAWWLLGAVMLGVLLAPPTKTSDRLGLRRFLTPEVSSEWRVGQRFTMNAPEMDGIEICAAAVGRASGSFRVSVRDLDARDVERSADVSAADLLRDSCYLVRFEPIEDSADHQFQIDIAPSPDRPGRGVALRATKGPRPEQAALRINDVPRWGSLAFQSHTPSRSMFRTLLSANEPERPPRWLALIAFLAAWLSIRFIFHAIVPDEALAADATSASA